MINGCDRMATTGMSALATAQAVARAMGAQTKVMEMLNAGSQAIGDLIEQTSVLARSMEPAPCADFAGA